MTGTCTFSVDFSLYKTKKMDLAELLGLCRCIFRLFGFMYGSFFGFEDVLKAIWLEAYEPDDGCPAGRKTECSICDRN